MFTASKALNGAQAKHYYDSEWKRGDYYTRSDEATLIPGRWFGRAAAELGYTDDVEARAFGGLLEGRRGDGELITAAEHGTGARRAGWDFTCSADKSVSIAALALGDERLIEAHTAAVERAMTELEGHVQTRMRHGKNDAAREVQTTGRLAAALFQHESSRNLDPQLHTHCVVFNLTRRDDGQWRALQERSLFGAQRLLTTIYRSEMARSLHELGYAVEVRKDGTVGIAGIDRETIDAFSTRRAEVLEQVRELGEERTDRPSGASARQQAALSTRASKEKGVDREGLHGAWEQRARERGLDLDDLRTRAAIRRREADPGEAAREAVTDALEHLAEREAVFRMTDLERVALERGMGKVSLDDVRHALASRIDLLRAGASVTTQQALERERDLVRVMRAGQGQGPVIDVGTLSPDLSAEQAQAVRYILETDDLVLGVEGKAGAGKSFTLGTVQEVAQRAGWTVRGFAPTTSAAEVLRESHIQADTVARLLREKDHPGAGRGPQLWIVDEAGLLSTKQAAGLFAKVRDAGAKVVLVGDRMQHRAVEAGQPFAQLVDAGMRTVRLEEIRRQRDAGLREAVREASEGRAARAVLLLDRQGLVVEVKNDVERRRAVAERYMALQDKGGKVLVVTADNAERHDINRRIRQRQIGAGRVRKESVKADVLVARDLTPSQRRDARSYDVGDHVTFHGGSRVYGVEAGARGRVTAVDPEKNTVRVKLDAGEVVTYNPRRLAGVDVARVESRRFAVGDRIEFRAPDREQKIVNGALGHLTHLDLNNRHAVARLDNGRRVAVDLSRAQALDHGYASTSYRSQGRTVDHVIDVEVSRLASREKLYVSISRGRDGVTVFTDDRQALVRRVERDAGKKPAQALDLEREALVAQQRQADLIAAAARELAENRKRMDKARDAGRGAEYDLARADRYDIEQRARGDLDQVGHHELLERRAVLEKRIETATPHTQRALRQEHAGVVDRLYEMRHGERSELGSFTGRLPLRDEVRLHDAHRKLNERADKLEAPELRSPLTRELLAERTPAELHQVVERVGELAEKDLKGAGWMPASVARRTVEQGLAELADLAAGRSRKSEPPDHGWTIEH